MQLSGIDTGQGPRKEIKVNPKLIIGIAVGIILISREPGLYEERAD